ncbi:hypothetical protein [Dactylosporangium sp. CS-033363]|uniref:hypothetical protein n=1 Tax=Dactylosporangium sp. CS-033363 TaxID=3239935 RepID=UPI003D902EA2
MVAAVAQNPGTVAASDTLIVAERRGDGPAYWIVMSLLPAAGRTAQDVTAAYESATSPGERPVCVRLARGEWELDPSVLPAD